MILSLTNANCYLNGRDLIGKVEEATLPDFKPRMTTYKPLGMQSEIDVPSGFEKMEATLKLSAFHHKELLQLINMFNVNIFNIRGHQENFTSIGKVNTGAYICTISGIVKSVPLGNFKQGEMTTIDIGINVYSLQMNIDGNPLINVDVMTNNYVVGDLDLLQQFKASI